MLDGPKMHQKFFWAIIASAAYMSPEMSKITIFENFSKVSNFSSSGFQYEQNPTESRKSGYFWNLSAPSIYLQNLGYEKSRRRPWPNFAAIWKMWKKSKIFFSRREHFLNFPKLIFYRFPTILSQSNQCTKFVQKNLQNEHLSALLNFSAVYARQKILGRTFPYICSRKPSKSMKYQFLQDTFGNLRPRQKLTNTFILF